MSDRWRKRYTERRNQLYQAWETYEEGGDDKRAWYHLAKLMHTTWQNYDGHN